MFSLSRLSIVIMAFFLGFTVSAGAFAGITFYALNSITLNNIAEKTQGQININTDAFLGDEPEVNLRDKSIIGMFGEIGELIALNENFTINNVIKRYDLIIKDEFLRFLSNDVRNAPMPYLFTDEGKALILSSLYIGQIQGFECRNASDDSLGTPGEDGTYWYSPRDSAAVEGIEEIFANFTLYDLLGGNVSSDNLLEDIKIADILNYTYDEATHHWYDSSHVKVTGVMAVFADCTVLNVDEKLNSVNIGELLGYVKNGVGEWCIEEENGDLTPVHVFMNAVSNRTMNNLSGFMEDLTIGDIIPTDQRTGFVGILDPTTKFTKISSEVNTKFNETSMRTLIANDVIVFEDPNDKEKFLNSDYADKNISEVLSALSKLAP